jgi:hypothetical protein
MMDESNITWPLYTHYIGPDEDGNEAWPEWTRGGQPGDQVMAQVAVAAASCRHTSVLLRLDTTANADAPLLEPGQFQILSFCW